MGGVAGLEPLCGFALPPFFEGVEGRVLEGVVLVGVCARDDRALAFFVAVVCCPPFLPFG